MTDIKKILVERGETYGEFIEHAKIAQELKSIYRRELALRSKVLEADQFEAIDMIVHKIARIINGNPNHADSWVDIAGYAKLVADRLEK